MQGAEYGIVGVVCVALLALLGFILRHVITKTIPEMLTSNAEIVKSTQASHTAVVTELIGAFKEEQKEQRTLFREQSAQERAVCERRHAETVTALATIQVDLNGSFKEQRHALKDLSNQVALNRAVVEQVTGVRKAVEP